MPGTIPLIIIALVAISILVLVHELGHFIAAILSGVWVEEFGIGLPPRVWGKKIKKTIFSLNLLPMGGFVRLHGEIGGAKIRKPGKAYVNKPKFSRIFIAVGGVIMNFLLAIVAFSVIYWYTGIPKGVKVVEVLSESPAAVAGIKAQDLIIRVDDKTIKDYIGFSDEIAKMSGQSVNIEVQREEKGALVQKTFTVVIRSEVPEEEGPLGIIYSPKEIYFPKPLARPFVFAYYGFLKTLDISNKVLQGMGMIFGQLISGKVPKGVAGPVGVTILIAEVAKLGILPLIEFSAIISINLALLNIIPFPPLDGSRVLFIVVETIFGKKIVPKVENVIYTAGMVTLLLLVLVLTLNEIPKLLTAGSLSKFVDLILQ